MKFEFVLFLKNGFCLIFFSLQSVGDSSVSSGSAASARGTSPSRSDDSRSISPIGILPSKIRLRSSVSNASSAGPYASSPLPLQTAMLKKSISSNPLPTGGFGGLGADGNVKPKKRAPPPPPTSSSSPHKTLTQSISHPSSSSPAGGEGVKPAPTRKKEAPVPVVSKSAAPMAASAPNTSETGTHSRHSSASDSSGYHEASASSILSDQQQEMIRNDR